jgi:hypothetical protein
MGSSKTMALKVETSEPKLYPRKSVAFPILIGWCASNFYGVFLYRFVQIPINCEYIIPKLIDGIGLFPRKELCEGNSLLWSSVIIMFLIYAIAIISVFILNRKYYISEKLTHPKKFLGGMILIVLMSLATFFMYLFYDLKPRLSPSLTEYKNIFAYCRREIFLLHFFGSCYFLIYTLSYLTPRFSKVARTGD